jgi:hypothetical protein
VGEKHTHVSSESWGGKSTPSRCHRASRVWYSGAEDYFCLRIMSLWHEHEVMDLCLSVLVHLAVSRCLPMYGTEQVLEQL